MGLKLDMFHNERESEAFAAGQVVFAKGDPGNAMYVVLEGEVELLIGSDVVETLGPGEPFGEMALIDRAPRIATVVAKTDCRLLAIPEKRFLFLVQQTPYFALHIMRIMAERLRKMNERH